MLPEESQETISLPWVTAGIITCFICFGIITSNHLSPNLNSLSLQLHLSPRIAGLTLLSLGNATPDIFTTYTALSSNSTGLAMGELMGSASFIICVVFGSMTLMDLKNPIKVTTAVLKTRRILFLRDIIMFTVLVACTVAFLFDAKLWDYECGLMILGYVAYLSFVIYNDRNCEKSGLEPFNNEMCVAEVRNLRLGEVISIWKTSFDDSSNLRRVKSQNDLLQAQNDRMNLQRCVSSDAVLSRADIDTTANRTEPVENDNHNELYTPQPVQSLFSDNRIPNIFVSGDDSAETTGLISESPPSSPSLLSQQSRPQSPLSLVRSQISTQLPLPTSLRQAFFQFIFPQEFDLISIIIAPLTICFNLIIPTVPHHFHEKEEEEEEEAKEIEVRLHKYLLCAQTLVLPLLLSIALSHTLTPLKIIATSAILTAVTSYTPPIPTISLIGFITSLLAILVTSDYLVSFLQAISKELNIPQSLLGITVLTVGNSIGDLISNLTLVKLGHVDIAIGACVGGPLSYLVLGLGLNGLVVIVKSFFTEDKGKRFLELDIDKHFIISSAFLLVMIFVFLITAIIGNLRKVGSSDGKVLNWRVGLFGIFWWFLSLGIQIWLEMK